MVAQAGTNSTTNNNDNDSDEFLIAAGEALLNSPTFEQLKHDENEQKLVRFEKILGAMQRKVDRGRKNLGIETIEEREAAKEWPNRLNPLSKLTVDPPAELLCGWLHPYRHTILFGHGDVGKGTLAIWWAIRLAREHNLRVMIVDFEDQPGEWQPRAHSLGANDLMDDAIQYFEPRGSAIWEQADEIAAAAKQMKADFIIVDSIIFACMGTDASSGSTDAPARYRETIAKFDLPTLSLAHIPKDAKEPKYPFGSIFWHNAARVTIRVDQFQTPIEGTVPSRKVSLTCCKYNNGLKPSKQLIEIIYSEGPTGMPIQIETSQLNETQGDVMVRILREHKTPMSTEAITKAFNEIAEDDETPTLDKKAVGKVLRREAKTTTRKPARTKKNSDDNWVAA